MVCGGFLQGKVGDEVTFRCDGNGLISLTGRKLIDDGAIGETLTRRQLEEGWPLDDGVRYHVSLMPVPSSVDLRVQIHIGGKPIRNDLCAGGIELRGPWTIQGVP